MPAVRGSPRSCAKEIANGVVVFESAQAVDYHAARVLWNGRIIQVIQGMSEMEANLWRRSMEVRISLPTGREQS
jgi:hypothetical protein